MYISQYETIGLTSSILWLRKKRVVKICLCVKLVSRGFSVIAIENY